jgi:hypothetical protein
MEVHDARLVARFADHPYVLADPSLCFYASVPMLLHRKVPRRGQSLGRTWRRRAALGPAYADSRTHAPGPRPRTGAVKPQMSGSAVQRLLARMT